jgi:hypothetical protein
MAKSPPVGAESGQGKTTTFSDAQIAFVVQQWKRYKKERTRVKINAFTRHLRAQWSRQSWLTPPPSRKTIEDMLLANGCRTPKIKSSPRRTYYPRVKRHFPHAQTVLDGKEVIVSLNGTDYPFVMEFSKDMATDAIGGWAVGSSETAELVKQAFDDHSQNHHKPLSMLIDNRTGNVKAALDLGAEGVLVIKAHPFRGETKGQIEGEFGLFERQVSHIVIQGDSERERAMNILKKVAEVYLRLRNQTPRCSVCPFTPEKLMKAKLGHIEADKAYQALKAQKEIKEQHQEKRLRISRERNDLADSIVKEHRLTGDLLRFKKNLSWIELSTLKEAESAFAVQSQRDHFDPGKRTIQYFYAIARNKQLEKDKARKQQVAHRRYGLDQKARKERDRIKDALDEQKQKRLLDAQPHLKITEALKAEMSLPPSFRSRITMFRKQIDHAIRSLLRKKKQKQHTLIEKTHQEIMRLSEFSLDTRYEMIKYVNERIEKLTHHSDKVVTPD